MELQSKIAIAFFYYINALLHKSSTLFNFNVLTLYTLKVLSFTLQNFNVLKWVGFSLYYVNALM